MDIVLPAEEAEGILIKEFLSRCGYSSVGTVHIGFDPERMVEVGNQSRICWKASPLLASVVEDIERGLEEAGIPKPFRAIDIGCGAGRDSVYLALRGWHVAAIDNLAVACERVGSLARSANVTAQVKACCIDVEKESISKVWNALLDAHEGNAAHLVLKCRYLHRPLLENLCESPIWTRSSYLLVNTFVKSDTHVLVKPKSPNKFLYPGEMTTLCPKLKIIRYEEVVLPTAQPVIEFLGQMNGNDGSLEVEEGSEKVST